MRLRLVFEIQTLPFSVQRHEMCRVVVDNLVALGLLSCTPPPPPFPSLLPAVPKQGEQGLYEIYRILVQSLRQVTDMPWQVNHQRTLLSKSRGNKYGGSFFHLPAGHVQPRAFFF